MIAFANLFFYNFCHIVLLFMGETVCSGPVDYWKMRFVVLNVKKEIE